MATAPLLALPTASYDLDLLVRRALSLGGVCAAAIYAVDRRAGLQRLAVASGEHPGSQTGDRADARAAVPGFVEALASELDSDFLDQALASCGLHETPANLTCFPSIPACAVSMEQPFSVVAVRLDVADEPAGLMAFLLDHQPTGDERSVLEAFGFEAARSLELLVAAPGGQRRTYRQLIGVFLSISEAALLSKENDLPATLQLIVDRLRVTLSADAAIVQLVSQDGTSSSVDAVSVSEAGRATGIYERSQMPISVEKGVLGWVQRMGRPALVANMATDARARPRAGRPAESVVAAPLIVKGNIVGILRVSVLQPARFGPSELQLVELLAQQVGIAVENARLYQSARDQNSELRALYKETRDQKDDLAILGQMFVASPEAIVLIGRDERIHRGNPAAERLYGRGAGDLIGKPIATLMAEENYAEVRTGIRRELRRAGTWKGEVRERRGDGSAFLADGS